MYRDHTNGLCCREVARDQVWERQRPLVSLDLLPALAKEEFAKTDVVIFALVLSLGTQKVEQGLKEPESGAVLAFLIFSPCLVLTQHETERKMGFRRGKGSPYNEEFN